MKEKIDRLRKHLRRNATVGILLIVLFAGFSLTGGVLQSGKVPAPETTNAMKRYGKVIKVKPEKLEYYKKLHAEPWPEVISAIRECHICNFSIYLKDGYLFSYYEYVGNDHDADMKKLSELTREWLKETDPCQEPVETAKEGEWWAGMEEVFHTD